MVEAQRGNMMQPDLREASRLLALGMRLCKLERLSKRPAGERWNTATVDRIDPNATGYGLLLAANGLCSIDPDRAEDAERGLRAVGFDLQAWMSAGVRTVSTRPGSGGRSTFAADGDLRWIQFRGRRLGVVLELRANSANLQDAVPGVVYASRDGELFSQAYGNCRRLESAAEMPRLPDDLQEWWERCSSDLAFLHRQQEAFLEALGDEPLRSVSSEDKGGKVTLAFSAPRWRASFNRAHTVDSLLTKHGYRWHAQLKRWEAPNATGAPGIRQIPGKDDLWHSDHASDALCGTFDAWTAYVVLEHDGDVEAAKQAWEPPELNGEDIWQTQQAPAQEMPAEAPNQAVEAPKPVNLLLDLSELHTRMAGLTWIVRGILPAASVGMIFGASGTFKSFIALDLALSIDRGLAWCGKRVTRGDVVYVAAEGGAGLMRRVMAWHQARGLDWRESRLRVCIVGLDIIHDARKLARAIQERGLRPSFLVIDTMSQTFGGNENAADEVGEYLKVCNTVIAQPFGAAVGIVHHQGHSLTERPRGSSAMLANVDWMWGVFRENPEAATATLTCAKNKDAERFEDISFLTESVNLGVDDEGYPITSLSARCAESMADVLRAEAAKARPGRPSVALPLLLSLIPVGGVHEKTLRVAFLEAYDGATDAKERAYRRALKQALEGRLAVREGDILSLIEAGGGA